MRRMLARCPGVALSLALAAATLGGPAKAQEKTTPLSPSSAQPSLPDASVRRAKAAAFAPPRPGSPVVQSLVGSGQTPLLVHKQAKHAHHRIRQHYARAPVPADLERPALAGVTLLQPLPPPQPQPHIVVPLPAYPLESVAAAFLTPAPPIVCHRTARIRDLPDPRLYREETLDCEPDTP